MFIPSVRVGQDYTTNTIYTWSLTYTYKGVNYISTNNVIYVPEDKPAPIPAPPLLKQDFSSKYYYVYNYSHFVGLVNSAFQAAYADLANQAPPGDSRPLFATVAPYLDFDFQSNRIILNAEQICLQ